ncbi:MAG: fibronectin type III domain-containing protein [Ruminococcus sp.]|nr:fibronectin type III domain-containing protein [Ruminococcus sp.]
MTSKTHSAHMLKLPAAVLFLMAVTAAMLFLTPMRASAATYKISAPEQLVNINWKNAGYGPGNTYIITNDFTLGDGDDATCLLTKGKFVIDFNGHTVQNSHQSMTVFSIRGADVTFKDSKASNSKASVRSYGVGAVEITAGSLTIQSGTYAGISNGTNNPVGLHVGGGTCTINGGNFYGDYCGSSCAGGTMRINAGTFQGGYTFALMNMGGNVKITKGNFISGTTTYGYQFALGAYAPQSYYDFSDWFVSGTSLSTDFQTGYWNMQSQLSAEPFFASTFAVAYNTPQLKVSLTSSAKPAATTLKSVKNVKTRSATVKWKKRSKNVTGYQIQYSTSKKFKSAKSVKVKGKTKTSKKLTKLKKNKTYYVRVRTYRNVNGTTVYSKWSSKKSVKVKK